MVSRCVRFGAFVLVCGLLAGAAAVIGAGCTAAPTEGARETVAANVSPADSAGTANSDEAPRDNADERAGAQRKVPPSDNRRTSNILFDYREERSYEPPALEPARARKIFRAVFGADVPPGGAVVKSAVSGSFTEPHAEQMVYLIQRSRAAGSDSGQLPASHLAVFDGERLVSKADAGGADAIVHTSDLNYDAVDELLLQGGSLDRGVAVSTARLTELKGGPPRVVKDFGSVFRDSCGAAAAGGITAAVIRYGEEAADGWPRFEVDFYQARCPSAGDAGSALDFRPAPGAKGGKPE